MPPAGQRTVVRGPHAGEHDTIETPDVGQPQWVGDHRFDQVPKSGRLLSDVAIEGAHDRWLSIRGLPGQLFSSQQPAHATQKLTSTAPKADCCRGSMAESVTIVSTSSTAQMRPNAVFPNLLASQATMQRLAALSAARFTAVSSRFHSVIPALMWIPLAVMM